MSDPTRIVIMADSAAMPRGESWGNIPFEETYPYLFDRELRARLGARAPLVIERGMRFRTMEDVLADWEIEIEAKRPEVLILQVGGSDCAPRVLSRRQRELVDALPPRLRAVVLSGERRSRRLVSTLFPGRVYVPLAKFTRLVEEIVRRARALGLRRLVLVNIIPMSAAMEHQMPGVTRNVERYNAVFDAYRADPLVSFVDLNRLMRDWGGPDALTLDGMHMTARGQTLFAQELARRVLPLFSTAEVPKRVEPELR